VLAENDAPSFILVNAIFLLGTFTFAIVLGVVSDDIGNELKAIRSGNYPVLIKDHGNPSPLPPYSSSILCPLTQILFFQPARCGWNDVTTASSSAPWRRLLATIIPLCLGVRFMLRN